MSRATMLPVAVLAAAAATLLLAVVRLAVTASAATGSPEAAIPWLVAAAACCVAALTVRLRSGAAWLASIAGLSVVTIDLAALARSSRGEIDADAWRWLTVALCVVAILAVGAAVAYATERPRRLGPWVGWLGVVALGWMVAAAVWALGSPDAPLAWLGEPSPLGSLGIVTRSFLVSVAGFVALGLAGDARPAVRRAHRRLEITGDPPTTIASRARWYVAWARASAEELAPGRSRARQAARTERSRIARELHADVVPALRRALSEAERDGSIERLAGALRDALTEVDALVASRHPIVLEVDGLVPAIEWLAERIEDRSDVRVDIAVADADPPSAGRPPEDVAAAAYRVAELALDNAARHAPGSRVALEIDATPARVGLVVADDGPGVPDGAERAAVLRGARGLADMRAEASAVGARLEIARGADGVGTRVTFDWPAP